jgi:signal transduction histidine kinase
MLGHELRNPLNAIAMSQAIIEQIPAQNSVEERARAVARRQTAHLTRLVNDLLEVSRVTRGKIVLDVHLLDLAALLRQVINVVRETTVEPRRQSLHASLPDYAVPVMGDRVRLEQVFTNLLDNASKYTPDGGRISVELDVDSRDADAHAVVTVSDTGRGIASEQLGQVFNLFYQGQPTEARIGTGLGIGLTLVRSLVESHGGAVAVRSEGTDRGSEFEVRLPARPEAAISAAHDPRYTSSKRRRLARGSRTALIVEDNADAREMLETLCRAWGYRVELAGDGIEGLDQIVRCSPRLP